MDFRVLYPDIADNLFLKWTPAMVDKIISYTSVTEEKWTSYLQLGRKMEDLELGNTWNNKFAL